VSQEQRAADQDRDGNQDQDRRTQAAGRSADARAAAVAAVEQALREAEAEYENPAEGHYVVALPGTRKLSTACSLLIGDHTLSVNAFVVRSADENHEGVFRWLLERNAKLAGIAFAIDHLGDVYLVGRLPLGSVTAAEVDGLLGTVLEAADNSFNTLLGLGFAGSIRREWEWRLKRGEPTYNLAVFERLRPDAPSAAPSAAAPGPAPEPASSTD
jgi:hypothetical protein